MSSNEDELLRANRNDHGAMAFELAKWRSTVGLGINGAAIVALLSISKDAPGAVYGLAGFAAAVGLDNYVVQRQIRFHGGQKGKYEQRLLSQATQAPQAPVTPAPTGVTTESPHDAHRRRMTKWVGGSLAASSVGLVGAALGISGVLPAPWHRTITPVPIILLSAPAQPSLSPPARASNLPSKR